MMNPLPIPSAWMMFTLPSLDVSDLPSPQSTVAVKSLGRARAGQSDNQIAAELTAAGYHAPLKGSLNARSVVRIRKQHGVYSRKTEFFRQGLAGWITLGQAVERLGEQKSWAYYLIRKERLVIERDSEIGLHQVRDNKKVLRELKKLLRGERFSLTLKRRSS
jgi:hypothetical protein